MTRGRGGGLGLEGIKGSKTSTRIRPRTSLGLGRV